MKVSPVQGVPTIPQPSATGLSPEKIQRLKTIASGGKIPEETKEPQELETQATHQIDKLNKSAQNNSIKMSVNRTPKSGLAQALVDTQSGTEEEPTENAVSDTDVQTKSEPEAIQPISPQLAALARQRRALQVKESEIAEREKALAAKPQTSFKEKAKVGSLLSSLQEELGISQQELYQRMTDEILGNGQTIDPSKIEEKILKQVEERLAGKDSSQEQAVFDHMKRNVDKLTFSSNDFRLIRESKSQDDVMELIRQTWKGSGEVLDEEEACQRIESVLREDAKRYAKVMSELETPNPVQEQSVPSGQPTGKAPQLIKTLTNKDSARPVTSRRQRAIAAALGQK